MRFRFQTAALATALLLSPIVAHAQSLVVTGLANNTANANTLADSLLGSGLTRVGNATLVGAANQQGTFTTSGGGTSGVIGFRDGILLTSGLAANAVGPNSSTQVSAATGSGSVPEISGSIDSNALQIQFTAAPGLTNLRFSYVFASDEYPEFVGQFNDGFGIFVNGTNVALLPAPAPANTVVSINTVNASSNSSFYVDNTSSALNTQYDGLTTVLLTADVTSLLNGGTNTLRVVISDRGDSSVDSGVFIQANSFTQGGGGGVNGPEPSAAALALVGLGALSGVIARRRTG